MQEHSEISQCLTNKYYDIFYLCMWKADIPYFSASFHQIKRCVVKAFVDTQNHKTFFLMQVAS